MKNNYLVVMAGGIGSRFWPMSTAHSPKQFLDILGTGQTMIQQTVHRLDGIVPKENVYVVTSASYADKVKEQLPFLTKDQILLEPVMRNTAPCIAYASYKIKQRNCNARIVVAPSDHLIMDETSFRNTIQEGLDFVHKENTILTLGIQPHRPETGYGYIYKEDLCEQSNSGEHQFCKVKSFKEKPSLETAKEYLAQGHYLWNSGIFLWNVNTITSAFNSYLPSVGQAFSELSGVYYTALEQDCIDQVYPHCENISIDYGILERAENIFTMPCDFGWSDLGTWGSLWEKRDQDVSGNSVVGNGVHLFECSNTIVTVPDDRTLVLQGLDDYIVVEANGVFMVCKKEEEQRIKEFRAKVIDKKN